jgi:hypothetical protein
LLCEVHGNQAQLDELDAAIRDLNTGQISEENARERLEL